MARSQLIAERIIISNCRRLIIVKNRHTIQMKKKKKKKKGEGGTAAAAAYGFSLSLRENNHFSGR